MQRLLDIERGKRQQLEMEIKRLNKLLYEKTRTSIKPMQELKALQHKYDSLLLETSKSPRAVQSPSMPLSPRTMHASPVKQTVSGTIRIAMPSLFATPSPKNKEENVTSFMQSPTPTSKQIPTLVEHETNTVSLPQTPQITIEQAVPIEPSNDTSPPPAPISAPPSPPASPMQKPQEDAPKSPQDDSFALLKQKFEKQEPSHSIASLRSKFENNNSLSTRERFQMLKESRKQANAEKT